VKPFGNSVVGGVFLFFVPPAFFIHKVLGCFYICFMERCGRMEIVCQRVNYVYWDFYVVFVLMNSGVDTYGG